MRDSKMPSHRAYVTIPRQGKGIGDDGDMWLNIGSAFPHTDGGGFTVFLGGVPTTRQVILRQIGEVDLSVSRRRQELRQRRMIIYFVLQHYAKFVIYWIGGGLLLQTFIILGVAWWWR